MKNLFVLAGLIFATTVFTATAQQVAPPVDVLCPSEEKCQVLVLSETEIRLLTQENGILATAAQARNLDLGQFVAYFRQKIALAPAGKNVSVTATAGDKDAGTSISGTTGPHNAAKQPEPAKK